MPLLYTITAAGIRRYLRNTPAGVVFTDRYDADDVLIETPYSPAPLTLAIAATMATPVVLLFPDEATGGTAPLYPVANGLVEGSPLAASRTEASQIFRRWFVRAAPADGYYICQAIGPTYAIGECDIPILSTTACRVYEEDLTVTTDHCESCDAEIPLDTRWCSHGCRCDVEPGYERSWSRC